MPGAEMCSEEKQSSEGDRDQWGWGWALMCMEQSGKASLKRCHWNRDLEEVRNGGSQEKSIPDKNKGKALSVDELPMSEEEQKASMSGVREPRVAGGWGGGQGLPWKAR